MLQLTPMALDQFQTYLSFAINEYAEEKIQAGTWQINDALENSEKTYTRLLPNGLETSGNYFYSIYDEINIIGYIWLGTDSENESNAFIFDFEIYKQYQNNGFGSKAIILAEKEAKNMGFRTIGLHVFGSNQRAIHVYQKCGYGITDIKMQKAL